MSNLHSCAAVHGMLCPLPSWASADVTLALQMSSPQSASLVMFRRL